MKTYKGFTIVKADPNTSGIRWYARTPSGVIKADTLAGLKELLKAVKP